MHVCIARAATGDYGGAHGKTLTTWPRFIFEVNARSRIYRVNASAFLPCLRARCGPLFALVLFAVKNGKVCGGIQREGETRYVTKLFMDVFVRK